MAGKKIGDLPKQSEFLMGDLLLVEQGGVTKSSTVEKLVKVMKGDQGIPGGEARIDDANVRGDAVWSGKKIDSIVGVKDLLVEGTSSILASNTVPGRVMDLQILGNTVQGSTLSDIKSVGAKNPDGKCIVKISTHGKNACDGVMEPGAINKGTGGNESWIEYMRSVGFIPVHSSMKYYFKCLYNGVTKYGEVMEYDANKKFIKGASSTPSGLVLSDKTKYVRVVYLCTDTGIKVDTSKFSNAMVSTYTDSYEPYRKTESILLLPCELEKIGSLADRLYYDVAEGAWCIDKYIEHYRCDSRDKIIIESFYLNGGSTWYFGIKDYLDAKRNSLSEGIALCTKLPPRSANSTWNDIDLEGVAIDYNGDVNLRVRVQKSKIADYNKDCLFDYIRDMDVMYARNTPRKIVLPQSAQIELDSMDKVTNLILECGEIPGTLKARMYKSLGGSTQSASEEVELLDSRVKSIEGLLDTQSINYECDSSIFCYGSQDGIVDNIRIQGRTYNNIVGGYAYSLNKYSHTCFYKRSMIKPDTTYTAIVFNQSATDSLKVYWSEEIFVSYRSIVVPPNSIRVFTHTTRTVIDDASEGKNAIFKNDATYENLPQYKVILLEGNHTDQYPDVYFEDLSHTGSTVDVMSVISSTKNLTPYNSATIPPISQEAWNNLEGTSISMYGDMTNLTNRKFYLPRGKYSFIFDRSLSRNVKMAQLVEIKERVIVGDGGTAVEVPSGWYTIRVRNSALNTETYITGLTVLRTETNITEKDIIPYGARQSVNLMYYNSQNQLAPIPELSELDTVEKHSDGKWYWHKKGMVLNYTGSSNEYWVMANASQPSSFSTVLFQIMRSHKFDRFISNRLHYRPGLWSTDVEGICSNGVSNGSSHIQIRVKKSSLETVDDAGIKKWLSKNNLQVVVPLVQEEVYEMAPLYLDSHQDLTLVSFNEGCALPKMEFSIMSDINKIIWSCNQRLRRVEERIYENAKSMLAGDAQSLAYSLYPSDFINQ